MVPSADLPGEGLNFLTRPVTPTLGSRTDTVHDDGMKLIPAERRGQTMGTIVIAVAPAVGPIGPDSFSGRRTGGGCSGSCCPSRLGGAILRCRPACLSADGTLARLKREASAGVAARLGTARASRSARFVEGLQRCWVVLAQCREQCIGVPAADPRVQRVRKPRATTIRSPMDDMPDRHSIDVNVACLLIASAGRRRRTATVIGRIAFGQSHRSCATVSNRGVKSVYLTRNSFSEN